MKVNLAIEDLSHMMCTVQIVSFILLQRSRDENIPENMRKHYFDKYVHYDTLYTTIKIAMAKGKPSDLDKKKRSEET